MYLRPCFDYMPSYLPLYRKALIVIENGDKVGLLINDNHRFVQSQRIYETYETNTNSTSGEYIQHVALRFPTWDSRTNGNK